MAEQQKKMAQRNQSQKASSKGGPVSIQSEQVQQVGVGKAASNSIRIRSASSNRNQIPQKQPSLNNKISPKPNASRMSNVPTGQKPRTQPFDARSAKGTTQQSNAGQMTPVLKNNATRTGMPPNIKNKLFGGSETHLSSNTNGMGLWVHQTSSSQQNNFIAAGSENLPPINKPPRANLNSVELQAEKGLTQLLEKKYQEAVAECDRAQLKVQSIQFECDMAKNERNEAKIAHSNLQYELEQTQLKLQQLESQLQDKAQELDFNMNEKSSFEQGLAQTTARLQQIERQLQFEQKCRADDSERFTQEVKDLQDQIAEYEEETMTLQHQIYELKIQLKEQDSTTKSVAASPQKSVQAKASPVKQDHEREATSEEKKIFKNAFGESHDESTERIKHLEAELKQFRLKVKKEEESRRQYQDIARKKDEEVKLLKENLAEYEKKVAVEVQHKQSQKTLLVQKDNKIKMLEQKLKSLEKTDAQPDTAPKSALKPQKKAAPTIKQKQIGRITKSTADAEKQVVDSIKKKPVKFAQDSPQPYRRPPSAQRPPSVGRQQLAQRPPSDGKGRGGKVTIHDMVKQESPNQKAQPNVKVENFKEQETLVQQTPAHIMEPSQVNIVTTLPESDSNSDEDNAPPAFDQNDDLDMYGQEDEEIVPVKGKPFLFGNVDNL